MAAELGGLRSSSRLTTTTIQLIDELQTIEYQIR